MSMTEVFCTQQAIIDLQSKAIGKLFMQLMQYITPEEADSLDCVADINQAAKLRTAVSDP
jgi:hypothetical protein